MGQIFFEIGGQLDLLFDGFNSLFMGVESLLVIGKTKTELSDLTDDGKYAFYVILSHGDKLISNLCAKVGMKL